MSCTAKVSSITRIDSPVIAFIPRNPLLNPCAGHKIGRPANLDAFAEKFGDFLDGSCGARAVGFLGKADHFAADRGQGRHAVFEAAGHMLGAAAGAGHVLVEARRIEMFVAPLDEVGALVAKPLACPERFVEKRLGGPVIGLRDGAEALGKPVEQGAAEADARHEGAALAHVNRSGFGRGGDAAPAAEESKQSRGFLAARIFLAFRFVMGGSRQIRERQLNPDFSLGEFDQLQGQQVVDRAERFEFSKSREINEGAQRTLAVDQRKDAPRVGLEAHLGHGGEVGARAVDAGRVAQVAVDLAPLFHLFGAFGEQRGNFEREHAVRHRGGHAVFELEGALGPAQRFPEFFLRLKLECQTDLLGRRQRALDEQLAERRGFDLVALEFKNFLEVVPVDRRAADEELAELEHAVGRGRADQLAFLDDQADHAPVVVERQDAGERAHREETQHVGELECAERSLEFHLFCANCRSHLCAFPHDAGCRFRAASDHSGDLPLTVPRISYRRQGVETQPRYHKKRTCKKSFTQKGQNGPFRT